MIRETFDYTVIFNREIIVIKKEFDRNFFCVVQIFSKYFIYYSASRCIAAMVLLLGNAQFKAFGSIAR